MDGRIAHAEACRHLLLAVALCQEREGLAEPRRQLHETRLRRADQLAADQRAEFTVKEFHEPHLASREVPLSDRSMAGEHANGSPVRHPAYGCETVVDPTGPSIIVETGGSVPLGAGNQLWPRPCGNHARDVAKGAEDRIPGGTDLPQIGHQSLV